MDEEGTGPSTRAVTLHTLLRLAALVAAALAVPRVLDHLGARDVSWAPPEYGLPVEAVDPIPRRVDVVRPADPIPPHADAARSATPIPPQSRRLP